jgi:hypothetical protein
MTCRPMHRRRSISLLLFFLVAVFARAAERTVATSIGEMIYVPIYSSIFFHDSKRTIDLAATLSIHNVDPDHSLDVTKVAYHDTAGKLIRNYVEKPVVLAPFETRNFVIEKTDTTGGTGANFIVEWRAADLIVSPLVEALMVNLSSNQSISFTSQGKVIKSFEAPLK